MKKHLIFDKEGKKYSAFLIGLVFIICCLPYILTRNGCIDFTDTGQIGDTIGGIMGPFVAIIAAVLTFIAFWVQYQANALQRHDIAVERFENNLFEMLHIQQEIINGLLIEQISPNNILAQKGRDAFQFVYEQANIVEGQKSTILKEVLKESDEYKVKMADNKNIWFLDHYFRHLYRIFKYIDDADREIIADEKKYEYACIVRATLSQYELVMLFYNGFSHPKFKVLIEEYAIFNNLRQELLASESDLKFYKESAFTHV